MNRADSLRRAAAAELRGTPALLPGAIAITVLLVWVGLDGSFVATRWLPGGLVAVVLLGLVIVATPGSSLVASRATWLAVAALAAFTVWSYATIAWAGSRGDALDGANRTLVYLVLFSLFAIRTWRPRTAGTALGTYAVVVSGIGIVDLYRAAHASDPRTSFIAGRLAVPISYPNATCAILFMAAAPAVVLAGRRTVPLAARAVLLAAAGIATQLALICQSRASLIAVPVTFVVLIAFVPGRIRTLTTVGAVAVATALISHPLLHVFSAVVANEGVDSAVKAASRDIILSGIALAALGAALAFADRFVNLHPKTGKRLEAGAIGLVAIAAIAVVVAAAPRIGNPVDRARTMWNSFKGGQYVQEANRAHFTSGVGSGRYDIWRVAFHEFQHHPIAGVGVDNFAADYLRERTKSFEEPQYPHSIELRTLAQTGIIGTLILLLFLGSVLWSWGSRWRRSSREARALLGAFAAFFTYWFVHGSVDWFWEMPALGGAAFAFLGLALAVGAPEREVPLSPQRRLAIVVPIGLACFVILGAPWLSARAVDDAASNWPSDPAHAFDQLRLARELNPLSAVPDLTAGVIAGQVNDDTRLRAAYLQALKRNPHDWYPMVELAAAESRRHDRAAALTWLRRAEAIDPLETSVTFVRDRVKAGKPVTAKELDQQFISRAALLTGATQK
jgi:hypothetical protein